MVAVPAAFFVTVTALPETDTVATPVLLEDADIAPLPVRVTVNDSVVLLVSMVMLLLLRLRDPAALPIFHVTLFAEVVPSDHL
jgi:hypothetical protein